MPGQSGVPALGGLLSCQSTATRRKTLERIPLCLIGCGGMGHRHILAYKELAESGIGNIELMAVCDANPKNADLGKREVERLFGRTAPGLHRPGRGCGPSRHRGGGRGHGPLGPPPGSGAGAGSRQARPGRKASGHHHTSLQGDDRGGRTRRCGSCYGREHAARSLPTAWHGRSSTTDSWTILT